jgi:hypothetical protein
VLPPLRLDSTIDSIKVGWSQPHDDGGCPITGFALFRDDSDESVPSVEVNTDNDANIRDIPTLREVTVTNLPADQEGNYVRFMLRAYNREGYTDSSTYSAVMFAAVPDKPGSAPTLVEAQSNSSLITVTIADLVGAATGNSPIQGYEVQMDDGRSNTFVAIDDVSMVLERSQTVTERGLYYRLKYRAINSVGWGPFSDVLEVLAAEVPEAPPTPELASSTDVQMTLNFYESQNDGGARISAYELWVSADYFTSSPTWTQVTGYTSN